MKDEMDDAEEGVAKNAGGELVHEAPVVDGLPPGSGREGLVMRRPVLGDTLAELVDGPLVDYTVGGDSRPGDVLEGWRWQAERVAMGNVDGVQPVQHGEGTEGALVVAPGELGGKIQGHFGVRVIL